MRKGKLVKAVALLVAVSLGASLAGCYGKFQLTRKLNEINESVEEPYLRSAVTWVFVIPYVFTAFLDFAVFNVIEFWSGENPLEPAPAPAPQSLRKGDEKAVMTVSREGEATVATIVKYRDGRAASTLRIRDEGKGTVTSLLTVPGGETVRRTAVLLPDGSIEVTEQSRSGSRTERYSPSSAEIARARAIMDGRATFSRDVRGAGPSPG